MLGGMNAPAPLHYRKQDLVYLPLSHITPYASNPRKNAAAVPAVKASIKEFGWQQPLVLDTQHVIVIGDTRYRAACEIAAEQELDREAYAVPCFVAAALTPEQIKVLRIVDNKSHEKATWDYELLQLELTPLDLNAELIRLTFDPHELDVVMAAAWTPPAIEDKTGESYGEKPQDTGQGASLTFSTEEWEVIHEAIGRWAAVTEREALPPRQGLVALCRDYLARVSTV